MNASTRAAEPWYEYAAAALRRIQAGATADADWDAIAPFSYGRWNKSAEDFEARMNAARHLVPAAAFSAGEAFDPPATRAALAVLGAPVTIIAGGLDLALPLEAARQLTGLFPSADLHVVPGAGHFPWIDDPAAFVAAARRALGVK
ncbi:alpha/beta fold hydrolase [Arthrobacter sp. C152]